jgi:hypothetical protein
MKRSARVPLQLSESLHKRLSAYALAASAAGVGALALAQPVAAKIIYTKTHQVINTGQVYKIDLDNDGVPDFQLSNMDNSNFANLAVCPANPKSCVYRSSSGTANEVWGKPHKDQSHWAWSYASAVPFGFRIGPNKKHFQVRDSSMLGISCTSQSCKSWGPWKGAATNRYLGFKFSIKGRTHYGWARLSVGERGVHITATLTGYAYETIPNKPIIAGKTHGKNEATLGRLAQGASAVSNGGKP